MVTNNDDQRAGWPVCRLVSRANFKFNSHAALLGVILIFLQLARRTRHIGAGHVHGTGAPVVADW